MLYYTDYLECAAGRDVLFRGGHTRTDAARGHA